MGSFSSARSIRPLLGCLTSVQINNPASASGQPKRGLGLGSALGFFDLDFLLLFGHLCRLWQVDVQHALIKLPLDLGRIRIERQRDCSAERAVAALYHMPVLVLIL